LYGAGTWTPGKEIRNTWKVLKWVDRISWTDLVSNNKVLQRVKKENILQTIRTRKAN
jgi:hypothetical protein